MSIKSLVVVAVLATAFLCFGGLANAETTSNSALIAQLQAQISALQAQLLALQPQQNSTTTAGWCYTFNRNLGFAQSGATDIAQLHVALEKQNISYSPDEESTYDEGTAAAVSKFQVKYGILQTGYVGVMTRTKLNTLYGCSNVALTDDSTFTVTFPTTGAILQTGGTYNLSWTNGGADISGYDVYLLGGPSSPLYLGAAHPMTPGASGGMFIWEVPSTMQPGSNYQIKFVNGSIESISPVFAIASTLTPVITVASPASGLAGSRITIHGSNFVANYSRIRISGNGIDLMMVPVSSSSTLITADMPSQATSGTYNIQVINGTILSNAVQFNVISSVPQLTITFPTAGAVLRTGGTYNISWANASPDISSYEVYLVGGASNPVDLGQPRPMFSGGTGGIFIWDVPTTMQPGNSYSIEFFSGSLIGTSPTFSIAAPATPVITSITPTSGISTSQITVNGSDFISNSSYVRVSGNGIDTHATLYATGPTQMIFYMPQQVTPGVYNIQVGSGSALSNTVQFTVTPGTNNAPVVSTVNAVTSLTDNTITVTGQNMYNTVAHIMDGTREAKQVRLDDSLIWLTDRTLVSFKVNLVHSDYGFYLTDNSGNTSNNVHFVIPVYSQGSGSGYSVGWRAGGTINNNTDTYYDPRIFVTGSTTEYAPSNEQSSIDKWCQMVVGKNYTTGSAYTYTSGPGPKARWDGTTWLLNALTTTVYSGSFTCSTSTVQSPVNGACGSASGQTFSTAPATNLCSAGTASSVSTPEYVGGWYWTCAGLNGGTSTHCTAIIGSAQPSITITSPNGGTFSPGQQVTIEYAVNNFPRAVNVQIQLNKGATYPNGPYNPVSTMASGFMPSTGSYVYTIPTSVVTGNDYSFSIESDYPSTETSDIFHSNNFTIIAPVSGLTLQSINWMAAGSYGDVYSNPRVNFGGADMAPFHDNTTATKWCQAVPGKGYQSGISSISSVNPQDGSRFKWDGNNWVEINGGDYVRNYTCSIESLGAINLSQKGLASLSDAIIKIMAQIQALLKK